MGDSAVGILLHNLKARELIDLPSILNACSTRSPVLKNDERWHWYNENATEEFLLDFWRKDYKWYIDNSWSINDLAIISGPENFELTLLYRNMIVVENCYSWFFMKDNGAVELHFRRMVSWISKLIGVDTTILTSNHNLYYLDNMVDYNYDSIIQVLTSHHSVFEIAEIHN